MTTSGDAMTEVVLTMAFFSLIFQAMKSIFLELIRKLTAIAQSVLLGHHQSLTTRKYFWTFSKFTKPHGTHLIPYSIPIFRGSYCP